MDNDEVLEIKAQIQSNKIAANHRDLEEFDKLGKRHSSYWYFVYGMMPFVALFCVNAMYPIETELFQILVLFSMFFSFVIGIVKTEIENTNRRIDLLHKINKQNTSKNT